MTREWKPGQPIPREYSGMPVTFAWNEVALMSLLSALKSEYPSGYASMVGHIRDAMRTFTPPKPEEPTGLGAVVEDDKGVPWVRTPEGAWFGPGKNFVAGYYLIDAVRVLSEGVQP